MYIHDNILTYPAERHTCFGTKLVCPCGFWWLSMVAKKPRQAAAHIVKPCSLPHGSHDNSMARASQPLPHCPDCH